MADRSQLHEPLSEYGCYPTVLATHPQSFPPPADASAIPAVASAFHGISPPHPLTSPAESGCAPPGAAGRVGPGRRRLRGRSWDNRRWSARLRPTRCTGLRVSPGRFPDRRVRRAFLAAALATAARSSATPYGCSLASL